MVVAHKSHLQPESWFTHAQCGLMDRVQATSQAGAAQAAVHSLIESRVLLPFSPKGKLHRKSSHFPVSGLKLQRMCLMGLHTGGSKNGSCSQGGSCTNTPKPCGIVRLLATLGSCSSTACCTEHLYVDLPATKPKESGTLLPVGTH